MRIFVTGSRGLLGSVLAPHLEGRGHTVLAAPSRTSSASGRGDLANFANASAALDATRPDVVINLAALTDVDYCEAHPEEAYRINAGLVLNLARWIEASSPTTRLIQVSTDQVYSGAGPHLESAICPINFYGYSKALADEYVQRVGGTSLRTNFFGASVVAGRPSFSDWIVTAARAAKPITVYDDVLFSPLSLGTLVQSIERVIRQPAAGIFNLGSMGGMSKADFAYALVHAAGLSASALTRGRATAAPRPARRPADMRMDSGLFGKVFGVPGPQLADEIDHVGRRYQA